MSALHELLTRAEEAEIEKASEVENLRRHKAMLKEAEESAKRDLRSAHGIVVRLRGALDAISTSPDCERILALEEAAPTLVVVQEPPIAFTPALDYPDTHPIDPPWLGAADIEPAEPLAPTPPPAPIASSISRPSTGPVKTRSVTALADEVMIQLLKARHGSTASLELETLMRTTGKSHGALHRSLDDLVTRKLIRRVKAAERGHVTVLIKDAPAGEGA